MTELGWIIVALCGAFIFFFFGFLVAAIIASTQRADLQLEIVRLSRENDALRVKLGIHPNTDLTALFADGSEVKYNLKGEDNE